ncbi:MAG TPA: glycosyltransferase family 4 protein [Ktedonobacteraceae bacterium]|nr:glycosyltransferase family 4 protein [Ktedonobacteraceae bacterium]
MPDIPLRRIAMTTTDNIFDAGGVENSIARIARGVAATYGIAVDILMFDASAHTAFKPEGSNGITRLESPFEGVTLYRLTPWTSSERREQRWTDIHYALLELAEQRRYDLMQAFYATVAGFPTVYAARQLGIPALVSIRGSDLISDVFKAERFHYLIWALEHATTITAVSQEGLDRARLLCNRPDVGRVILNSIRPQDFAEGVEELSLTHPVVGSLAVFRNKKGLEVLLAAFHMLLQRYATAHLLLVGYVLDTEQQHFAELVMKYDLADKFTLTGRIARSDALRYLRLMDVFAFSSQHDGCPNAVLEAMLAGLPMVASRAGALPQMLEHGKGGLLVQPGSAVELYEAIATMLDAEHGRRSYGQMAKERALTYFAPQRELDEYMQVYGECFVGHRYS